MEGTAVSKTPYDDVFRTMVNDCKDLLIPVINEVFHESYTGNETVQLAPDGHFLNQQDHRVFSEYRCFIPAEHIQNAGCHAGSDPDAGRGSFLRCACHEGDTVYD